MSILVGTILNLMASSGEKVFHELDENTKRPDAVQKELLDKILSNMADTEIGSKLELDKIKTVEDFQQRVPLMDYDAYGEYIDRMLKGEKNVLTSTPIVHFNETSGTLGAPKAIPVTEDHISVFAKINSKYVNYLAKKAFGTDWMYGKGLSLSEGTYKTLPTGVTYGCASSLHTARMQKAMPFMKMDSMDLMYTSPKEARQPSPGTQTRYLHARFALMERDIRYGNATFSSYLLELFRYIEKNHELLCNDIENGTISTDSVPKDVRIEIEKRLKPDPKRAAELRAIFKDGFDAPIARKLWPKLKYFICVGGAGFAPYTDQLRKRYLGNDVHFLFLGLSASEAMISVPISVDNPDSVFLPDATFFEFIPVINGESDISQGIRLLGELETGKQYEVVISNVSGLLRYRIKDVIEVTGFYNKTPLMRFVKRSGAAISMYGEKTTEEALRETAFGACREQNLELYDYCVCPYGHSAPGKYIFLYELNGDYKNKLNIEQLRDTTEKLLEEANPVYRAVVEDGRCGELEVRILQEETFLLYRDLMIAKGKSAAQLKPVHVTNTPFQEKFFLGLAE